MKKKGFTLTEILIAVGLCGILFALAFSALSSGRRSGNAVEIQQDLQNQLRLGLESMSKELYSSKEDKVIVSGASGEILTFQVPVGTMVVNGISTINWGADGVEDYQARFLVEANRLIRRGMDDAGAEIAGSDRVLARNITSVAFTLSADKKTITITVTVSAVDQGQTWTQDTTSSITFRN